ncbi:tetratricopeptide repeat protein [Candidatus Poribacteria bacterium]
MAATESTPRESYEYDVFLSYSHAQKDWAHDLAQKLRDEGFKVWPNEWRPQADENGSKGPVPGVAESRKIILVLSPEFLDAQWPIFEVHIPILKDLSARHARVIPLVHTHCNLPLELVSHQTLDFSDTHGDALRYDFRLAQLMADLDPSRERPTDFNLFCATREEPPSDALPPVGQLPIGSMMPFLPDPNFVGREEELRSLYRELQPGDSTSLTQTVAVTGMCGIGKTGLAVEFIYRYGRTFSGGVFWLDASNPDGIPDEIACCAGPEGMNLPRSGTDSQDELVAAVMREWRGSQPRLLVFDGLESLDVIDRWKPVSVGTRMLITTRIDSHDPRWAELDVKTIPVDVLPREQSMELLCRGQREALDNIDESAAANAICELLGDLPMALHLAGAYLSRYRYEVSLRDFLSELRSQPILSSPALLGHIHNMPSLWHSQDLVSMFDAAVGGLDLFSDDQFGDEENTNVTAAYLFHLTSHFAPAPISRRLLIRALKMDEDRSWDRRRVADAVNRLCELGLINICDDGRLVVHRLLREYAYDHPARNQNFSEAAEDVASVVSDFVSKVGCLGQVSEELEHLKYVAGEAEHHGSHLTTSLYNQLGYHLHRNADLEGAREYYSRALEIDADILDPDHETMVLRNNNLGLVLRELGDLDEARVCFKRALEIDEVVLGLDHPEVAIIVSNLGRVLYELGDLESAKEHFSRALRINEAAYDADHPAIAKSINGLGLVLKKLGDLEGAKEHFARALQIDGEAYGQDHLRVARDANNLGTVLREMGELEGAEKHFRWALNILEQRLGTEHSNTKTVRKNLQDLLNARAHETPAG